MRRVNRTKPAPPCDEPPVVPESVAAAPPTDQARAEELAAPTPDLSQSDTAAAGPTQETAPAAGGEPDAVAEAQPAPALTAPDLLQRYAAGERDFAGAILGAIDLSTAQLAGINLAGADLCGANLSGAVLKRSNLRQALLRGANLSWADLYHADLSGADLSAADLSMAITIRTRFRRAVMPDGSRR